MPIKVKCEGCGAVMTFPDRMVGVEGVCSVCKIPIVVKVPVKPKTARRKPKFRRRKRRRR